MQILNDEALIKTWQARVGKPNRANRYTVSISDVINFYRVLERNLLSGAGRQTVSGKEHVFSCSSGYGSNTQKPFVALEADGELLAQIPPEGARALAHNLIAAAEAAEQDAFLVSFMQSRVGLPLEQAAQVLGEYRQWRNGNETQESS